MVDLNRSKQTHSEGRQNPSTMPRRHINKFKTKNLQIKVNTANQDPTNPHAILKPQYSFA